MSVPALPFVNPRKDTVNMCVHICCAELLRFYVTIAQFFCGKTWTVLGIRAPVLISQFAGCNTSHNGFLNGGGAFVHIWLLVFFPLVHAVVMKHVLWESVCMCGREQKSQCAVLFLILAYMHPCCMRGDKKKNNSAVWQFPRYEVMDGSRSRLLF